MSLTTQLHYLGEDEFQAVELPYGQSRAISMFVFVPSERLGLSGLLQKLAAKPWQQWSQRFTFHPGSVGLPRFKLEQAHSLRSALCSAGMEAAFDANRADFSGICADPLYLSEVKQKTYVEVDEKGTEVAVITEAAAPLCGGTPGPHLKPFSLIVDRPFRIVIQERATGLILFMGVIGDPR